MNKLFSHHSRRFGLTLATAAVAALVVSLVAFRRAPTANYDVALYG